MTGQIGKTESSSMVFDIHIQGAGHIAKNKPCQDYSRSFNEDGIQIVVVCDGHGGNTYVRSEKGARFAGDIALKKLAAFARAQSENIFQGLNFSITAKPKRNPFVDNDGNKLCYENLDETQKQYARQAQAYVEAMSKCTEQQNAIKILLEDIHNEWLSEIKRDSSENPFSEEEQKTIGNKDITKAYGCTLLAFLMTKHYWLAIQIGDGSIYLCDKNLSWKKPVPNDCSCFLNLTTSLSDTNPVQEFRYSFNGIDERPLAVLICSDGLDGSLQTDINIHNFFEQIISFQVDGGDIKKELKEYLPRLSKDGNSDDISLAGIIDLSITNKREMKALLDLRQKKREISSERKRRKAEIKSIEDKTEILLINYNRLKNNAQVIDSELKKIKENLRTREKKLFEINREIEQYLDKMKKLNKLLIDRKEEFAQWDFTIKNEIAEIDEKLKDIEITSKI